METVYLAMDGDDIGSQIEYFILKNDSHELMMFSLRFSAAIEWLIGELAAAYQPNILLSGGDTLLVSISHEIDTDVIEAIRNGFAERARRTLSMGLGSSLREAHVALKYAKVSGKNRLCRYRDI